MLEGVVSHLPKMDGGATLALYSSFETSAGLILYRVKIGDWGFLIVFLNLPCGFRHSKQFDRESGSRSAVRSSSVTRTGIRIVIENFQHLQGLHELIVAAAPSHL